MNKNIHKQTLKNGITLIVIENPTTEIIASRIFIRHAGSRWESPFQAGIFNLLASIMSKGTRHLSSLEIAEKIESIGAVLSTDSSTDYFLISMKTITQDFEQILALASEIIRFPSLPETELTLEKNITLQNILSQKEQPFNVAFQQLREMMYKNHPYGFSILGTESSVTNITVDDLRQLHQHHFRPDNLVISLAGKIDLDTAIKTVEKIFGDWQIPEKPILQSQMPMLNPKSNSCKIAQDTQQSIIMMGYLAPAMKSPDYPILKLLTTYLGSGLSSRLFVELREKQGLAYDVSAFYPTRLEKSQFVVYLGTAHQNLTIASESLQKEINRLRQVKLTEDELQISKNKLLGQYALSKQTNAEFAQIYGWYETLELGIEYDIIFQEQIQQITVEDIINVANKYLLPDYLNTSIVGRFE